MSINGVRGLQKVAKFGCSDDTFRQLLVIGDFDGVSLEKYGQLIIQSLSYTSMVCAIGGLPKCAKFIRIGDTFQGCWLLLILMIVPTQKYGQLII